MFRAKNYKGEWVYGTNILVDKSFKTHEQTYLATRDITGETSLPLIKVKGDIFRGTEIRDINGEEIYEGDFIKGYVTYFNSETDEEKLLGWNNCDQSEGVSEYIFLVTSSTSPTSNIVAPVNPSIDSTLNSFLKEAKSEDSEISLDSVRSPEIVGNIADSNINELYRKFIYKNED